MTPLDNLTSAFECLWEAKLYLLRTSEGLDPAMAAEVRSVLGEVAVSRDRVQKLLIELLGRYPHASPQPKA